MTQSRALARASSLVSPSVGASGIPAAMGANVPRPARLRSLGHRQRRTERRTGESSARRQGAFHEPTGRGLIRASFFHVE
jgi:hypothetical protein